MKIQKKILKYISYEFQLLIYFFRKKALMGMCSPPSRRQQYRLSQNNSFLICERNCAELQNKFEIIFIFDSNISTKGTTIQQSDEKRSRNRYQIPVKKLYSIIETTLDQLGSEIQKALTKAQKLDFTKIEFAEPHPESHKIVQILFKEIIRMLICFDQKQMFKGSKIYLNWSGVDNKRQIISQVKKELTM